MTPQQGFAQAVDLEEKHPTEPDCVDIASEHSFPASDPPAWIFRDNRLLGDEEAKNGRYGEGPFDGIDDTLNE